MKPYVLFLNLISKEDCHVFWYGWKHYHTPDIAIQAFKDLRTSWQLDYVDIGRKAKIIGNGAITFYEDIPL